MSHKLSLELIRLKFYVFQAHLREAEIIVKEAIRMLLYEPVSNPEGLLAKQAMYELKELRMEKTRMEKFIKRKKWMPNFEYNANNNPSS